MRERVDAERALLGLDPLPPHQDKPGPLDMLKKYEEMAKEGLVRFLMENGG